MVQALPADLHIQMPDLPGYGGSDPLPPGEGARTQAMAAAVGKLIETGSDAVWLAGHSYGGNVALHAALRHRARVKGALLLEPVFVRALALADEREALERTRAFVSSYVERVDAGEPEAVSTMVDFWFGDGAFAKLPAPVQGFLTSAAAKNIQDVRASFAEAVSEAELAALDCPVTIACGGASPPVAGAIAGALAGLLPQAEVVSIPGATHGMLDTHSQEVARLIEGLRGPTG